MLNPDERVIIAKRPLKKCDARIEDVYIFQVFKEARQFQNGNSLRGFRDKQAELKLYASLLSGKLHRGKLLGL